MPILQRQGTHVSRRTLLASGTCALTLSATRSMAAQTTKLPLPSAPRTRELSSAFPQKGEMIVQRWRAPLLETPFDVFDKGVFTPNDRFFVRWHYADIPVKIDVTTFRLKIHGNVEKEVSLTLDEIMALPHVEVAAVNQCSGNSRGLFMPRVAGGEWGDGAMGNARWTGVRMSDVLKKAGIKPGSVQIRLQGLEKPSLPGSPPFLKSLSVEHAMDGEVMIAFAMNGQQLPHLNGFPLRVVVPGWYATYWVKMLSDIEVLDKPDTNFWMATAYTIPDTPRADMKPGEAGVKFVPINKMVPRSFITNVTAGAKLKTGINHLVRGMAFGGASGVKMVELSVDGGKTWKPTQLGKSEGKYSFRRWESNVKFAKAGDHVLQVRCTNDAGEVQPPTTNWNPAGFMRNVIQSTAISAA
ncbi:MAG: molybdopterin-dependent oxidoreductase [Hyphomicrobiales bacterium]|nr:molybdopterin-dependent oxidoreductase [Hyphomicrobiales bacterium]MDE2114137.1 molybdopterin-dependent oxidoreductase [Hyphomicrobiales bacterium]